MNTFRGRLACAMTLAISACAPSAAQAKPIAFADGTTVMAEYGAGTMTEVQAFYAPSYRYSIGGGHLSLTASSMTIRAISLTCASTTCRSAGTCRLRKPMSLSGAASAGRTSGRRTRMCSPGIRAANSITRPGSSMDRCAPSCTNHLHTVTAWTRCSLGLHRIRMTSTHLPCGSSCRVATTPMACSTAWNGLACCDCSKLFWSAATAYAIGLGFVVVGAAF